MASCRGGLDGEEAERSKGTYALLLRLEKPEDIVVGRLGKFAFPAGYYLYVGSALGPGGLQARLARHLRAEKRLHWHIDYLIQRTQLIEIWSIASRKRLECILAEIARNLPGAQAPVPRFGSSDCRCPSHLIYLAAKPDFALFEERLQARIPGAVLSREIK